MNCEQALELVALAASGDVTQLERRALEVHLEACEACRTEALSLEELGGQLAAMREMTVPDHVYAAVRARVVAEIHERRRSRWMMAWPAFAAVVACTVMLVVTLHRDGRTVTQPATPRAVVSAPAELPDETPVIARVALPLPARRAVVRTAVREAAEPLVVHMFTDDPDVVIYWIADAKGNRAGKEIIQ